MHNSEALIVYGTGAHKGKNGATGLVVLLHGYGADANDLLIHAQQLARKFPKTVFVCLQAPQICRVWPEGRQWFDLDTHSVEEYEYGVASAAKLLTREIAKLQADYDVTASKTAVLGFSQGAMVALQAGLFELPQLAGVMAFSGKLAYVPQKQNEVKSRPQVLLVHGSEDTVVEPHNLELSRMALDCLRVPVESYSISGCGHEIDFEGLRLAQGFLQQVLNAAWQ
ncbi:alpha/beta hydrolase [Polycladidibacter stylochi]|uniref:alpha/beta hydrolase n=1 Tax=Polycladidibacter stylochi TaxID=1807766 RepID=UPI00083372E1|nr:alpha/beta hydrolase-fold protein [Pseudovibrio stylochi]